MSYKKLVFLIIPVIFLFSSIGHSQIITSKKIAEKKGIYQKPAEKKAVVVAEKPKVIAVADVKPKEIKTLKPVAKPKKIILDDTDTDKDLVIDNNDNYLALQMINNAMSFVGVRYHGGGTSTSGMDCSGMVTAVFNIFDLKLPRSSYEMAKVGEKVATKDVRKGDLIFFHTNGRRGINHVGMVVDVIGDEIKFIHSSTGNGVMVSSTNEPYYKRTFAQVNRVLGGQL